MASTYYDKAGKDVNDGDIAYASDLNTINAAVDTGFQQVETDIDAVSTDAETWADKAEEWAEKVEDAEVEPGKYSSLHHAAKSSDSASSASTKASEATASASSASTSASGASTSASSATTSASEAEASSVKASEWAEEDEDVEVETGKYSAHHWAIKTEAFAESLSDTVYGSSWNGVTNIAPSKNTVYDKIESLSKSDVGLADVDNTSDANKPISTATQTALDGKANTSHTQAISTITDLQTTLDAKALKANVLELDNTTSFTPDADYEPATKKYVDDSGNLSVATGVIVTGNMLGLEYAKTGANQITIQPGNCWDSLNTTELELSSSSAIAVGTTINQIYNLFLCDDDTVRTDTDVGGSSLGAYKIRWIGFVRNNASGDLCQFGQDGDYLEFVRASECDVQSITTTAGAITTDDVVCPDVRVSRIKFGIRSISSLDNLASILNGNGTDEVCFIRGTTGQSDNTAAWTGGSSSSDRQMVAISNANYVKMNSGTATLTAQAFLLRR